jgi:hypothetical protein
MASEAPLPAPRISLVASGLLTIRQKWFDVCVGRCEGAHVVPVLRDSGEIWFLASFGDHDDRKLRISRRDLSGFGDHAARAFQYCAIASYLRSGGFIAEPDQERYLADLRTAIVNEDAAPIGFFLTRYSDEGNSGSALTYDIALFLTNDAGAPERILSSRSEHFEMVHGMEGSSDFLHVYGLLLQSSVATLLYGLSILQIATSFEHSVEVKRIRTAMSESALIATAPSATH